MARHYNVERLAYEAELEPDEVLVLLWDAGILYVEDLGHRIRKRDLNRARRAIGIATRRELMSPGHWQQALRLDDEKFGLLLEELQIQLGPGAKRLPKGAIARLKSEARRRGDTQALVAVGETEPEISVTRMEPLEWRTVGHPREMQFLDVKEIEEIHFALVSDFKEHSDPIAPAGVRSENLLSSAVHRPLTSLGKISKYPTVEMAGAALLHAVVQNHPFHNGNKRTALVGMLAFLDKNHFLLTCGEAELFRMVLVTAQHKLLPTREYSDLADREVLAISEWIHKNSRTAKAGDRTLQWGHLKPILTSHGCEMEFATVGNRLNIKRTKKERGLFGRTKRRKLQTQVFCGGDGRDADKSTIQKIRKDLHLDEENGGLDASAFYHRAPYSPDDFIVKYRKTLKRLAKL